MRWFALLLLLAPAVAAAQGTGTLAGRVLDEGGEGLPGANVLVEGTTLGAATDMDGTYRIIGVPVGTYSVTASSTGFALVQQTGVDVSVGYTRMLDFTLAGSFDDYTVCYVTYERPMISNDPFASRTISGDAIANLPTGR